MKISSIFYLKAPGGGRVVMRHNDLKKQLSYFFAVLLIMCTLSTEAMAADMNGDSYSLIKW